MSTKLSTSFKIFHFTFKKIVAKHLQVVFLLLHWGGNSYLGLTSWATSLLNIIEIVAIRNIYIDLIQSQNAFSKIYRFVSGLKENIVRIIEITHKKNNRPSSYIKCLLRAELSEQHQWYRRHPSVPSLF